MPLPRTFRGSALMATLSREVAAILLLLPGGLLGVILTMAMLRNRTERPARVRHYSPQLGLMTRSHRPVAAQLGRPSLMLDLRFTRWRSRHEFEGACRVLGPVKCR